MSSARRGDAGPIVKSRRAILSNANPPLGRRFRSLCAPPRHSTLARAGRDIVAAGAAPCVQFATLPQHSDGGHFRLRDNLTLIQHCGVGRRVPRTSGAKGPGVWSGRS
jgi:hypothetical protein